jgi:acetyl-CoA synthetase
LICKKHNLLGFANAKLNITKNCIDRHLARRGDKTAIIFRPNNQKKKHSISLIMIYMQVAKMANVLRTKRRQKKGDRFAYLPMIPELAISVLAFVELSNTFGFAGFSASAVATYQRFRL